MKNYNEEAELRKYLWDNYLFLCTKQEFRVWAAHIASIKAKHISEKMENASKKKREAIDQYREDLKQRMGDWNAPEIEEELQAGFAAFSDKVFVV